MQFSIAFSYSQEWYIVDDKDGYTNVRDINNKITDQLHSGKAVWIFGENPKNKEWAEIEYNKGGIYTTGYIHKSRLKKLSLLEKIPVIKETKNSVTLGNDTVEIDISKKMFVRGDRRFTFNEDVSLIEINDNYVWGSDGDIPREEYNSFRIVMGKKTIILPVYAYYDLFNPNLYNTEAFYSPDTNTLYLTSLNSDGAGGYVVLWSFLNGIFTDRAVLNGF